MAATFSFHFSALIFTAYLHVKLASHWRLWKCVLCLCFCLCLFMYESVCVCVCEWA
jgi:hypothetical protein